MKLLTINTHSLVESNYKDKLEIFVNRIVHEQPDIIAMQEVNQSRFLKDIVGNIDGMIDTKVRVKSDNHAYKLYNMLFEKGLDYYWIWMPIKLGYGLYDEGIALFSKYPITNYDAFVISEVDDYNNWRTRKVLGIETCDQWFYSVHMGWWIDKNESFVKQWTKLTDNIARGKTTWLMGDFNNAAEVRNEGYDYVISSGWYDTYKLALYKDEGITVDKNIDGWDSIDKKIRIDYIFTDDEANINSSYVIFNGDNDDVVSDHYGVIVDVNEGENNE